MKRTILTLTLVLGSSICTQSFGFDLLDRMLGVKGCGSNACDTGCYAEPTCGCEAPICEPTCGAEAFCDPCAPKGCGLLSKLRGGHCGPTCGCEAPICEPTCGAEAFCDPCAPKGCGLLDKLRIPRYEPTCGCEAPACGFADTACEPTCGCEAPCLTGCDGCGHVKRGGLMSKIFTGKLIGKLCSHNACDSCCEMPVCDMGCDSPCKPKRSNLLSKLFGNLGKKTSCCDMGCDSYGCGTPVQYSAPTHSAPADYSAPTDSPVEAAPMPPAPVVDPSASLTTKRRVIQASASYVR